MLLTEVKHFCQRDLITCIDGDDGHPVQGHPPAHLVGLPPEELTGWHLRDGLDQVPLWHLTLEILLFDQSVSLSELLAVSMDDRGAQVSQYVIELLVIIVFHWWLSLNVIGKKDIRDGR